MIDVDDHSAVHHAFEQELAEREHSELVARCRLVIAHFIVEDAHLKRRDQGHESSPPAQEVPKGADDHLAAVVRVIRGDCRAVFCVPPVTGAADALAEVDRAHPRGGRAERVVEVVDGEHGARRA